MNLRIGLDIDGTICDFWNPYLKIYGEPKNGTEITRNVVKKLIYNKDFWLTLPVINRPDFIPALYCTKRSHPKTWTKQYLIRHGMPDKPVYQIYSQVASKSARIKGRVDVFIDDSVDNFIELNSNGVPCLLIDNEANRWLNTIARIYTLQYKEISECYHKFIKSICLLH